MSEEHNTPLVSSLEKVMPGISLSAKLEKDDIVAIIVSQQEMELTDRRDALVEELNEIRKEIQLLTRGISDKSEEVLNDKFTPALKPLQEAMTAFGLEVKPAIDSHGSSREYLSASVRMVKNGGNLASFSVTMETPEDIRAMYDKIRDLKVKQSNIAEVVAEIKNRLDSVPQMERMAKAELAKAALSQSEDGKKLLDIVSNSKRLPEPRIK